MAKSGTGKSQRKQKQSRSDIAVQNTGKPDAETPVKRTKKRSKASGKKKKTNQEGKNAHSPDATQPKTPTSVGSGVRFLNSTKLEQYSEAAEKKFVSKPCAGKDLKERNARAMVEVNSNLIHLEIRNGMWPWVSDVSLADDGSIYFYRNQVNHNAISPNLSNEITNNFLGNPICTDLKGKVHEQDIGNDMICFLTYNDKVSVKTALKNFHNL